MVNVGFKVFVSRPPPAFPTGASFGAPLPGVGGCVVGLLCLLFENVFMFFGVLQFNLEAVEGLLLLLQLVQSSGSIYPERERGRGRERERERE